MSIDFKPLSSEHFTKLEHWLNTPHVHLWYGEHQNWTMKMVSDKYNSYCYGFKPIHAFIIYFEDTPIGYIQYYNAYDFPRDGYQLNNLPKSLAAIDMFIGDDNDLGKNLGTQSLTLFLDNHVFTEFDYAFVDPDTINLAAIKTYEKSGFSDFKIVQNKLLMVAYKSILRIPTTYMIAIELAFKKHFLVVDNLWIFGSRIDLTKKGGDIDLYIETNATTIDNAFQMKQKFSADLINNIGEQKIDMVLNMLNFPKHLPIHEIAKKEGKKII